LKTDLTGYINFKKTGKFTSSFKLLFLLVILYVFNVSFANSAEKGMDVALVLDTSGSMKQNDPNQLRIQAAKLFVSLLSSKDKVSLVGFSNRAYPLTPLLALNSQKNEKQLLNAIDKLIANGQYTNLHGAIKGGYELLQKHKAKDRSRHIILMSDGKMDLGNKERNLRLLEKTLDELAPKLAKEKIKVHAIAFTEDSYIPLLKLAAEDTDGQFILLKNANETHQVFENIFERTKLPEMLPLENDSFIVDKAVKEVTVVASKFKPDTVITMQSPDGEELSLDNHTKNVKWFQARKFDLITIKKPARGYWRIKYSEGGNKAYIVSDISLEATTTKKHADPGAPLHIQAKLKKKDHIINNKSILGSTKFTVKVTSPVGKVIENELKDDGSEIGSERKDGIYGISYAFDKQGPYKIEVTAKGETFDRKKTLFVDVKSTTFKTPFQVQQDVVSKPDILDTLVANNPKQTGASSHNEKTGDDKAAMSNAQASPEGSHTNSAESETDKITALQNVKPNINNHGDNKKDHEANNTEDGSHDSQRNSDEEDLSDEELDSKSHFGIKDAVIAFISFNAFLALLGGGYYFWYRKQQKKKDKDRNPDGENESANPDTTADNNTEIDTSESVSGIELEAEDSFSTSISDIDLEDELSSILENEKNDN